MKKLNWDESYCVNIPAIDAEHRLLMGIMNELAELESMPSNLQKQIHDQVLGNMQSAILSHFSSEERFMKDNCYPNELFNEHRQQHQSLEKDIIEFRQRYRMSLLSLTDKMSEFLYRWFIDHILNYDKKLGDYFSHSAS